jgi:hypothetical protein
MMVDRPDGGGSKDFTSARLQGATVQKTAMFELLDPRNTRLESQAKKKSYFFTSRISPFYSGVLATDLMKFGAGILR